MTQTPTSTSAPQRHKELKKKLDKQGVLNNRIVAAIHKSNLDIQDTIAVVAHIQKNLLDEYDYMIARNQGE